MIIYLVIFLIYFNHNAANNQQIFLKAITLQQEGKYAEASKVYESIEHPGWGVFYNNGLCYQQRTNYLMALYNFYKAHNLNPYNTIIKKAIIFTQKTLKIDNLKDYCFDITLFMPIVLWQMLFLVIFFIFLLIIKYQLITLKYALGSMVGVVLFFAIAFKNYPYKRGIMLVDKSVYCLNHEDSNVQSNIPAGCLVSIVDSTSEWYKICYQSKKGWITQHDTLLL